MRERNRRESEDPIIMSTHSRSYDEKDVQAEQAASDADLVCKMPVGQARSKDNEACNNDVPQEAQPELSRTSRVLVLVPVILTYFLWFLDLAVVSTATPAITTEFHSIVDVGWYSRKLVIAVNHALLTMHIQVRWSVSAWQFCSDTVDRQTIPFVLYQGKRGQDMHSSRSGAHILT